MIKKREVVLVTVSGLLQLALMMALCHPSRHTQGLVPPAVTPFPARPASSSLGAWYRHQRNIMSQILNRVKQENANVTCQIAGLRRKLGEVDGYQVPPNVSKSEDWYFNPCDVEGRLHVFDGGLATWLSGFLADKLVASFGEGPAGEYKEVIEQTGRLKAYHAYDWAPHCAEVSQGRVTFLDLTAPQYGLPLYDWVVSLGLPWHLPSTHEAVFLDVPSRHQAVFLDNVARHAGKGVVLSWRLPWEGGVAASLELALQGRGFWHDPLASQAARTAATTPRLKASASVFRRRAGVEAQADEA